LSAAPDAGPGIVVVALTDRAREGGAAGGAVAVVPYPAGTRAAQDRIVLGGE
jgi:hypothetical protein